jgi:CPA1 family monovalent cation:H+ antiporter
LPEEPADRGQEDEARRLAAAAGLAAIERARDDPAHPAADVGIHARAVTRLITLYRHRADEGDDADATADQRRRIGEVERALRLAGLAAERETVFRLAREARISDETSRKLVREIDLVDSRYR